MFKIGYGGWGNSFSEIVLDQDLDAYDTDVTIRVSGAQL